MQRKVKVLENENKSKEKLCLDLRSRIDDLEQENKSLSALSSFFNKIKVV